MSDERDIAWLEELVAKREREIAGLQGALKREERLRRAAGHRRNRALKRQFALHNRADAAKARVRVLENELRSAVPAAYVEGIRTEQGALDYPESKQGKSWYASHANARLRKFLAADDAAEGEG